MADMSTELKRAAGSKPAGCTSGLLAPGCLMIVVTIGTAALAALVVALGTIVVSRLDAATEVNALVAETRRQSDAVDDLAAELVLRAREPSGPLNSASLLARRGAVIEERVELVAVQASNLGAPSLPANDARADRLIDATRGMVDAGTAALTSDDATEIAEARALVDVFYRLFRHDLAEFNEALTLVESESIREQTDGVNTMSRWILLAAGISTMVVLAAGVTARRVARRERSLLDLLGQHATEDGLTGLLNRRGFVTELGRALHNRRHDERMALLFLDLDRFKHVNDSLGHAMGDELLTVVGRRIVGCARGDDLVGRLGGDEFAVLLRWEDGRADPQAAAERIRRAVMRPVELGDRTVSVGVSLGVRQIARNERDADELLRDADVAMFEAKHRLGGGIQLFDEGFVDAVHLRLKMEGALRSAITNGHLDVAYQPIFDASAALIGAEALVRWRHEGANVRPDQFLPVAKEMGLLGDLDRHVLLVATRNIADLNRRFGVDLTIAVNVAAEAFDNDSILDSVSEALDATGLAPGLLVIEITEQGALRSIDQATETLRALRSMGVQVALDDFGTGHSALAYLEDLPIDVLKVDRAFLPQDGDYGRARELFLSVVDLGCRLGFDVVAEGVETEAQLKLAAASGCTLLQGFLLGRPGPIEALTGLAAEIAGSTSRDNADVDPEEEAALVFRVPRDRA